MNSKNREDSAGKTKGYPKQLSLTPNKIFVQNIVYVHKKQYVILARITQVLLLGEGVHWWYEGSL